MRWASTSTSGTSTPSVANGRSTSSESAPGRLSATWDSTDRRPPPRHPTRRVQDLLPGQVLDQYQVIDVIARSGMASLYRARDLDDGRTVVLKVPYPQYESDIVFHERFRREEEIGLKLDHPSIIKVYKPRSKSRIYLALEYVEG